KAAATWLPTTGGLGGARVHPGRPSPTWVCAAAARDPRLRTVGDVARHEPAMRWRATPRRRGVHGRRRVGPVGDAVEGCLPGRVSSAAILAVGRRRPGAAPGGRLATLLWSGRAKASPEVVCSGGARAHGASDATANTLSP